MANAAYEVPPHAQNSLPTVYNPLDVKNRNAKTDDITRLIDNILLADEFACYRDMERYLIPPGIRGSKQFDQAEAVNILLDHDARQKGYIAKLVKANGMSDRMLWDMLQKTFRKMGFKLKFGRIVGFSEGQKPEGENAEETVEQGQPDID